MSFRFIHTADVHLDSPLKSLALRDPDIAELIGNATRQSFEKIVDLCLDEAVDALAGEELAAGVVALDLLGPAAELGGGLALTELGDALGVPQSLRKHLVSLTADYTMARYPDAANGVPYEIYDQETAEAKVAAAEELLKWLQEQIRA